jgi:hypothetical protein
VWPIALARWLDPEGRYGAFSARNCRKLPQGQRQISKVVHCGVSVPVQQSLQQRYFRNGNGRMLIRRKRLFWFGASLLFVGLAFLIFPPYKTYCEGDYANNYYCVIYELTIALSAFVEEHSGAFTALATVAIAWFTLSLRESTDRLWDASERHSERELRAYVLVDGGQFDYSRARDMIRGHIVVKNYGQTPAYNFSVFASVRIFEPDVPIFDFTPLHPERSALITLGPAAESNIDRIVAAFPDDFENVCQHERAIFMWGVITYRDAFGRDHREEFRCRNRHPRDSGNTWVMEPYPKDNS